MPPSSKTPSFVFRSRTFVGRADKNKNNQSKNRKRLAASLSVPSDASKKAKGKTSTERETVRLENQSNKSNNATRKRQTASERGRVGVRSPLTQQTLFDFQKEVKTQRSVRLPRTLFDIFLGIAKDITSNNTETCGIIAENDNGTDFVVTHLVIPEQRGMSDSCTAMDENTVTATFVETDFITVRWIHTHPSQTAFLSSIDLHTHAGYQALLLEVIAVVYLVEYSNTKMFKLTTFGMNTIRSCKQT